MKRKTTNQRWRSWQLSFAAKTSTFGAALLLLAGATHQLSAAGTPIVKALSSAIVPGTGATVSTWTPDAGGALVGPMTAIQSYNGSADPNYPTAEVIDGQQWEKNIARDNVGSPWDPNIGGTWGQWDGWRVATPSTAIACPSGASFVAVVKPVRNAYNTGNWNSIVDVMYDKLVLAIRNCSTDPDAGKIIVRRNGGFDMSSVAIPDGQKTILSLVCQADGSYEVWANGTSIMTRGPNGTMTEFDPNRTTYYDEPDWANTALVSGMTVGAGNWDQWWAAVMFVEPTVTAPNDWTHFNALPNRDTYWGYEAPVQGFKRSIDLGRNDPDGWTAYNGYIGDVYIYGEALSSTDRTDLEAALGVKFGIGGTHTITASAGPNGTITPTGTVTVNTGSDQAFTIAPATGYKIYQVLVDGVNDPAAVTAGSYTFSAVNADHTIAASFILLSADPTLLIDLKASTLTPGADLASWPNEGLIGGTFDKFSGGTGPNVTYILGKKSVEFVQPSANGPDRRTLASALPAPAELSGNNSWTMSAVLYRPSTQPGGENAFFQWAGGSYADLQSAIFRYTDNGAYIHWGADSGFTTVPSAGAWHNVTITFDGLNETIYVDGAQDKTDVRVLSINPGGLMILGGRTWHDSRGEDQYWRFNGAIASLKVFSRALSAGEVATLATTVKHVVTVTPGANGSITPGPGAVNVDDGDSPTFAITPDLGYRILDVLVDGVSNPGAIAAGSYTFNNVVGDHTIAATFEALPSQVVSGRVTDGTTGIAGATVFFRLSTPAYLNPFATTTTDGSGNYSISLAPASWHAAAGANGYDYSADLPFTVGSGAVSNPDIVLTANPNWDLLFYATVDQFASKAPGDLTGAWTLSYPPAGVLNPLGSPVVEAVDGVTGVNWVDNHRGATEDGFHLTGVDFLGGVATVGSSRGVSIVVAVKPKYNTSGDRGQIFCYNYDGITLAVRQNNGQVIICRKTTWTDLPVNLPDGQKTILTLVCQLDGSAVLYVDGVERWSGGALAANTFAMLEGSWNHDDVSVGRGFYYDGWSAFNGNIGDIYVYKTAISSAQRGTLEGNLGTKFGVVVTPPPVPATLSGTIVDAATDQPIYNAVVQVGAPGANGAAMVTAANGAYSLSGFVADGGIEVYADAVGYAGRRLLVTGSGALNKKIALTAQDEPNSYNGNMEDLVGDQPVQWSLCPWGTPGSIDWLASSTAKTGSKSLFYAPTATPVEYDGIVKDIPLAAGYTYNFYFTAKADAEVKKWMPLFEFHDDNGNGMGNQGKYVSNEPIPHNEYSHVPYYDWHTYFNWTDRLTNSGPPLRRTAPEGAAIAWFGFLYEKDGTPENLMPPPGKGCYIDDLVLDAVPADMARVTVPPDSSSAPVPTITSITGPVGGVFTINGTADKDGTVSILKSLNVAAPIGSWTELESKAVSAGGFSFQVPQGTDNQAFFRLQGK